jgi:hypothetical protein
MGRIKKHEKMGRQQLADYDGGRNITGGVL